MDWPWDWWVFVLIGLGGGTLLAMFIYYCYSLCGISEDDDKPTELESVIAFPGGHGERQNPIFNRRFSNASMQSSEGSVQLEVAEVPTLAKVSEFPSSKASSSQTTQPAAATEEDRTAVSGVINDTAATSSNSVTTEAAPEPELSEAERKAARAAKLKAIRAQRANKKDNEWALLEESLSIIDAMYNDVFQSTI
jgi:hypothetical protein